MVVELERVEKEWCESWKPILRAPATTALWNACQKKGIHSSYIVRIAKSTKRSEEKEKTKKEKKKSEKEKMRVHTASTQPPPNPKSGVRIEAVTLAARGFRVC